MSAYWVGERSLIKHILDSKERKGQTSLNGRSSAGGWGPTSLRKTTSEKSGGKYLTSFRAEGILTEVRRQRKGVRECHSRRAVRHGKRVRR